MSFQFNWPRFSDQFHYDAIQMLNNALNKGNKPPIIADTIEVVELEMGTQSPQLDIREIGELTMDQFRGIFRMTYNGDAYLVLKTKVQANPLNHKTSDIHNLSGSMGMLAAKQPLVVPMLLRLSHFELQSIVVLVVSKQKGITLVFKTDPLKRVDINSTFDSIAVIQKFIQKEIERQLQQMFREDLPGIIHRLSQTWVKAKVEAPYLNARKRQTPRTSTPSDLASLPPVPHTALGIGRRPSQSQTSLLAPVRPSTAKHHSFSAAGASLAARSAALRSSASLPVSPASGQPPERQNSTSTDDSPMTFPDIEGYDPTYGLRPEGLPTKSPFSGFKALFTPNRGLADLTEEQSETEASVDEYYDDAASTSASFDIVDWTTDNVKAKSSSLEELGNIQESSTTEMEHIPAVGGGVVTRPRIVHSQSMVQSANLDMRSPLQTAQEIAFGQRTAPLSTALSRSASFGALPLRPVIGSRQPSNPYFPPSASPVPGLSYQFPTRSADHRLPYSVAYGSTSLHAADTESSLETTPPSFGGSSSKNTQQSQTAITTPPKSPSPTNTPNLDRRPSISATSSISHSPSEAHESGHRRIVLRPSMLALNNSIHQFGSLSHSNHTLSPYTRSVEHFTVRSGPPRLHPLSAGITDRPAAPVKARRKRTYRFGGKSSAAPPPSDTADSDADDFDNRSNSSGPYSPIPNSEFDPMDMAHYFRMTPSDSIRQYRR